MAKIWGCQFSNTAQINDKTVNFWGVTISTFLPPSQQWPEAEFHIVPDAGHSHTDAGILEKLLEACEKYKDL